MGVLNIRVDDQTHEQLRMMATDRGLTLSDFIRGLIMEVTVPAYEREVDHDDQPAPMSLGVSDRLVLSQQYETRARLDQIEAQLHPKKPDPHAQNYHELLAEIVKEGYAGEYWLLTAPLKPELSLHDCSRVQDILEMFTMIIHSIDQLEEGKIPVAETLVSQLQFRGFDYNNALEGHMAGYVDFLIADGRWTDLKPQLERTDNGNSHMPMLETYLRMVTEYRRIKDSRSRMNGHWGFPLSRDDLERLSDARIHPSNRMSAV